MIETGYQRQLAVKLDKWTAENLDLYCKVTRRKRNRVINEAIEALINDYNKRPFAHL